MCEPRTVTRTLLLTLGLLLAAGPTGATTALEQTFPDLVHRADVIAVGTVTGIQEQWDAARWTRSMGGFKGVESAQRFCRVHDEVRNYLRPRSRRNEVVSLAQRRLLYTARTRVLLTSLAAA